MNVSWDEVPCSGRNGPVTGYYLTYTDPNSNNDFTINITAGGDNRTWTLAGLAPYTNYTVRISAYNYDQVGPTSPQVSQRTAQSGKAMLCCSRFTVLQFQGSLLI